METRRFEPVTIWEYPDFFEKSKRMPYLTIAVIVPEHVRPHLLPIEHRLRYIDNRHLYFPPEMWHITLKELGWLGEAMTDAKVEWIYKQLKSLCSQFEPFTIRIKGVSYFSDVVFWKIESQEPIKRLHQEIIAYLKEKVAPSQFEGDMFTPHVSLLYFASKDVTKLLTTLEKISDIDICDMQVNSICVTYGYPHLLLSDSEEEKGNALLCRRKFKLGQGIERKRAL